MKKITLILSSLFICVNSIFAQDYIVEPNHSSIGFSVPISGGLTHVTGKFTDFAINMTYDGELDGNMESAKFNVSIKSESILTGVKRRDDHLKSDVFFDVEKYLEITFTSTNISLLEKKGEYIIKGNLSIKGIEKEFVGKLKKTGILSDKNVIGFKLTGQISKKEFNVGTNIGNKAFETLIGDNIDLDINFWVVKKPSKN